MKTARILKINSTDNPFAEAFGMYSQRTINLMGQVGVIDKVNTTWSVNRSKALHDRNDGIFFVEDRYSFRPEEPEQLEKLKTYIYNSLVAQGVESFESYLKGLVKIIVKEKLGEPVLPNLKNAMRTNKERLKFIKNYLEPLDNWTKRYFPGYFEIFVVLEQTRHIIIHANQIIKLKENEIDIRKNKLFSQYFSTIENDGEIRLSITKENACNTMEELYQFAYILFDALSSKHKVPVAIY